jgi:hypothetical protein
MRKGTACNPPKNICVEGGGYAVKILLNEYKAIIDAE